ncbi:PadR family transcriptional regulator [Streptomyces sp. NPDC049040]|uniref:PadR family transcriptional regulator n=1 Tax=Streptomyces sp. NPDC049040 TaxID=3365593 RepID=UPI0037207906
MSAQARSSPLGLTVLGMLHTQPLHPYGIQRLIKQWGKDQVVNVGQRASLYRTIDRLHAGGLVAVKETERDQQYPERTVYEITDAGRAATRTWLEEMLAVPRQEFPDFPAALSHLMMLTPDEALRVLERREQRLAAAQEGLDAGLAAGAGLPRVLVLEAEYAHTVATAQLTWIRSTIGDLRDGRLTWSQEELSAMAAAYGDAGR